jgi:hypothetical protein
MRLFIIFILHQILCKGDEVKERQMGRISSMHGSGTILVGKPEGSNHLVTIAVNVGKLKLNNRVNKAVVKIVFLSV